MHACCVCFKDYTKACDCIIEAVFQGTKKYKNLFYIMALVKSLYGHSLMAVKINAEEEEAFQVQHRSYSTFMLEHYTRELVILKLYHID